MSLEKCKYKICDYEGNDFIRRTNGPHMGVYCPKCQRHQKWEKHTDNPKTKEEYKAEFLDKQPATTQQISYMRNLQRDGISKFQAMKIIEILKGEVV